MKYEMLPKRSLVFWELLSCLLFGGLIALAWIFLPVSTWIWYGVLWILGALLILSSFLYLPLLYLSVGYCCRGGDIIVKGGVIFYKTRFLKRDKISFVTVYNTPFTPLIHLSMLVITAPGSHLVTPFLESSRADQIADDLNRELAER